MTTIDLKVGDIITFKDRVTLTSEWLKKNPTDRSKGYIRTTKAKIIKINDKSKHIRHTLEVIESTGPKAHQKGKRITKREYSLYEKLIQ